MSLQHELLSQYQPVAADRIILLSQLLRSSMIIQIHHVWIRFVVYTVVRGSYISILCAPSRLLS